MKEDFILFSEGKRGSDSNNKKERKKESKIEDKKVFFCVCVCQQ